jgi:Protein-tyrosine phosphatase
MDRNGSGRGWSVSTTSEQSKGRAEMARVRLPDGTTLKAVSIRERRAETPDRDYGLYLDARWQPTWNADVIEWEDFGLPTDSDATAEAIYKAFDRAKRGERIEIGCIGGLGRTGTVLACTVILAGVTPGEAVQWVRAHYDPAAVETPEQEEWVLWFAEHIDDRAP